MTAGYLCNYTNFTMKFNKRTHTCCELTIDALGKNVTLNGWVDQKRDLGGVIFINLRDRYGVTQLTFNPDNKESYETSAKLGNEFVISASGIVQKRTSSNPNMKTGEIEVLVKTMEILNAAETPPFVVEEDIKASEELRFKYRYLDIRRKKITDNLLMRNKIYQVVHKYFEKKDFIEVETPILMKSTPEGARDYLVPSRIHHGKFYALPQSPQTYKQILMVAGLDKYVQICKCFRDEDLRADRQPEFTQIDLEMSFVEQDDVFEICEGMIYEIWKDAAEIEIPRPFKKMTYDEAMETYGTDKPDLRIKGNLQIVNITESVKGTEFKVFSDTVANGGIVAGIKLVGQEVTRKIIDSLTDYVKTLGFGGLGYLKYNQDGAVQSPIVKFLSEEIQTNLKKDFNANSGDVVFILSGEKKKVLTSFGLLRLKLAELYNLIDESKYEFVWIYDFPLFSYDEDEKRFIAEHHVFTMPKDEDLAKLDLDFNNEANKEQITGIRANCYDLVCNGNEFGSGSIRIHRTDLQKKVFAIIGLSDEEAKQKFGFLLEAFTFGAPPHGGFAFGLDRIVAILCGTKDIRETIAFPKTTSAISLMDGSPGEVDERQMRELGISLK